MIGANVVPGIVAARPEYRTESPLRVPGYRVFDLDDVGAPVGEDGARPTARR